MMTDYAYDELYLPLSQRVMGDMYDYAVNTLSVDIAKYHDMFMVCGMAHQFEIGNPTYVAGKNGCEVARLVIKESSDRTIDAEDAMYLDKSPEYWIGWSISYYQWFTGQTFRDINRYAPIETLYGMYNTFHEADISLFVNAIDERRKKEREESMLKRLRTYAGLSQRLLSERSGVPLRQIQLFEQGQRDIKKTQGETLRRLSKTLNCRMEDLI